MEYLAGPERTTIAGRHPLSHNTLPIEERWDKMLHTSKVGEVSLQASADITKMGRGFCGPRNPQLFAVLISLERCMSLMPSSH